MTSKSINAVLLSAFLLAYLSFWPFDFQLWGESKEDLIPVKIFCRQSSRVGFSEDYIKRVAYKSFSDKKPLKADINFFSSFHKDVSQDIRPLQSLSSELRPLKKMEFTKKGRQIKWSVDEEGKPSKSFTSSSHIFHCQFYLMIHSLCW